MKKLFISLFFFVFALSLHAQVFFGTTISENTTNTKSTLFRYVLATGNLKTVHTFDEMTDGRMPFGKLVQASNGIMYGVTAEGGKNDKGTIYSFDPTSRKYAKLKDFAGADGASPRGGLCQATNGRLYGMTANGGDNDKGVLYSIDPVRGDYTVHKWFTGADGMNPESSLVQGLSGKLYGTTQSGGMANGGVLFSFDPATSTFTKLIDFTDQTGPAPRGNLLYATNGKLYGATATTVFSFDPATLAYTVVKTFGVDEANNPAGSLMQAADGRLYGFATEGGASFHGLLFSIDPVTLKYQKHKEFSMYYDGALPVGSLVQAANGQLYGMAYRGGINQRGTVFSFDPATSIFQKIKDLEGVDGQSPTHGFIKTSDGKLYATVSSGGGGNAGALMAFDPATSAITLVKNFSANNGGGNYAGGMVALPSGKLYGITDGGGSFGGGVLFSFDPVSSYYTMLKEFKDHDGTNPLGKLLLAKDGKLYGTTSRGGKGDGGVLFSFDPASSTYEKLHDFLGDGFQSPRGGLTQTPDGKIYGTAYQNGNGNGGGIFSFDPATGQYKTLKFFSYSDGSNPTGTLIFAKDGKLYGRTEYGGDGAGVLFSFDPATEKFKVITALSPLNYVPFEDLLLAPDGRIFSMTTGWDNTGSIYSYNPATMTFALEKTFTSTDKSFIGGSFALVEKGQFFGTATAGGSLGLGAMFRYDPMTKSLTTLKEFDGSNGIRPLAGLVQTACDLKTFYRDADGDGFGDAGKSVSECATTPPDGYVTDKTDCDDSLVLYQDKDGDGFGSTVMVACGSVQNNMDCNDENAQEHPGLLWYIDRDGDGYASRFTSPQDQCERPEFGRLLSELTGTEDCNDNDPTVTVPTTTWYFDADLDGYYSSTSLGCAILAPAQKGYLLTTKGFDCDDNDPRIHSARTFYRDSDGDGYGNPANTTTACVVEPLAGYVANKVDCDDADKTVYPGGPELPDGKDNNCNGIIDEGTTVTTWYRDRDGDGFGDPKNPKNSASQPEGYVSNNLDCNDYKIIYEDKDNDGHGSTVKIPCGWIYTKDDCNDNDRRVHSPQTFYRDADGDFYGDASQKIVVCSSTPPAGYVANTLDCNDNDGTVRLPITYYRDADSDGFGDVNNKMTVCASTPPTGYVRNAQDCNDRLVLYRDNDRDGLGSQSKVPCAGVSNNYDVNDADWKSLLYICHSGASIIVSASDTSLHKAHGDAFGKCTALPMVIAPANVQKSLPQTLPAKIELVAFPNPFTGATQVHYTVPVNAKVSIKVYDVLGREAGTVFQGDHSTGSYTQEYKASHLPSGMYYLRLAVIADGKQYLQTQKLIKAE